MSGAKLEQRLRAISAAAIDQGVFPGCAIGVVDRDGPCAQTGFGAQTDRPGAPKVGPDTVYDVASVTKAIPVSTLALQALEQGLIGLDTRLIDCLPRFGGPWREQVTIRHLLTHTLDHGFRLSALKDRPAADIRKAICAGALREPPGTRFFYSNATSILLGMALERVLGADLHTLSRERLFDPLGMHSTTFHPERLERDRIAPTEIDPWRGGEVRGAVHDESAWRLREIMYPGSAGLFSTVADLTRFLAMALRGGRYRGVRVLSARTIDLIQHNQLAAIGHSAALGWELNQARYMGRRCSERTIGKTGFTGCVVIVDFERERGVVMLSNYTWPRRKAGPDPINAVRAAVADAVFG